ncbi:MAG: MBL fold metallo-hydrolase [Deltaproteobacteria bacterium]|nr:MBL fold metallo-hydrolase [Deltaproteobacteria bacterium]
MRDAPPRLIRLAVPLLLAATVAGAYPRDPGLAPQPDTRPSDSLYAPHRDADGRFFLPWASDPKTFWGALRWWLFDHNPYDKSAPPQVAVLPNDGSYLAGNAGSSTVTWVGHATFAVHDRDDVFLTDPHFSKRALLPRRKVPPGIPIEAIPADAFAVISHNHYDHLDAKTVEQLPPSVQWFVPLGLADWFRARGRHDVVELDWWQTAERGRWRVTCLPSQHWSRRIGQATNASLWCSWLIDSGEFRYFFAGDTGYFHGFREFGRRFADIDVAMLPIGAYEPRWFMRDQHMNPAEAYQAFLELKARFMLPMHWGTFDLTDEPVDHAPRALARVLETRGGDARVRTLAVGERWRLPDHTHAKR